VGDGGVLKIVRHIWEVGMAGWPSTGGVLNITAAAWTAGFHWWVVAFWQHNANAKC